MKQYTRIGWYWFYESKGGLLFRTIYLTPFTAPFDLGDARIININNINFNFNRMVDNYLSIHVRISSYIFFTLLARDQITWKELHELLNGN